MSRSRCLRWQLRETSSPTSCCSSLSYDPASRLNGMRRVAEQGARPLVLLCHGFGQTDRPREIEQYTLLHLVGDMVGLVGSRTLCRRRPRSRRRFSRHGSTHCKPHDVRPSSSSDNHVARLRPLDPAGTSAGGQFGHDRFSQVASNLSFSVGIAATPCLIPFPSASVPAFAGADRGR